MPADIESLDPTARQRLRLALDELRQADIRFNVTSGKRSAEKQAELYKDWLSRGKTGLPAAPPGRSRHERGTAVDLSLADEGQRTAANKILAKHGWGWPLGKRDRVHYEFDPSADSFRAPSFTDTLKPAAAPIPAPRGSAGAAGGFAATLAPPEGETRSGFAVTLKPATPSPSRPRAAVGLQTQLTPEQVRAAVAADPRFAGQAQALADARLRRQGIDPEDVRRRQKLGGLFPEGGDPSAALRTFGKAVFKVDDATNAAAAVVAKEVRKKGAGALTDPDTYRKAGAAADKALLDLQRETPPTAIRELFGMKKGETGRGAYNVAAVADYVTAGLLAPSNLLVGPVFEGAVAPLVKGAAKIAGKALLRGAERAAPKATAAVVRGATVAAEKVGVGPAARAGRQVAKQHRIDLGSRLQDAGQIVRELRDLTVKARKKSPAFDRAERAYANETGGQSRLQSWVYEYTTRDAGGAMGRAIHDPATAHGLRQAARKFGLPYAEAKTLGDRLVAHANETIARLEKAGAVKPGVLRQAGEAREQFLKGYAEQLFSRPVGLTLGEVGTSAFAGTNVKAVRQAATAELTERLAGDARYAAPVTPGEALRPGWAAVPDEAAFGKLRGMQAPAPIVRLMQAEAQRGLPAAAGDEVAQAGRKVGDLWRKVVGATKVGYISTTSTLGMNMGSNMIAAEIGARRAGVSPAKIGVAMPASVKETAAFLKTGKMSADIQEFSRYSNAFLSSEAAQAGVASAKSAADIAGTGGRVARIGRASVYLPPAREMAAKTLTSLAGLHGASEQASKLALFKALKPKLGAKRAAETVEKYLFDYSDRNALLEMLDRNGLWIFNSYPVKAVELLIDTLTTRPDLVMRYPRVARLLRQEMDTEGAFENLPEHRKGPLTFPIGGGKFIDASRAFPFTGAMQLPETAARIGKEGLTQENLLAMARSALPTQGVGILLNKDTLTGRDIVPKGTPPDERQRLMQEAFVRAYGPPLLTRNIPGIAAAAQGQPAGPGRYAEAQPLGEAVLQYGLGLPTVSGESRQAKGRRMGEEIDTRAQMSDNWIAEVEEQLAAGSIKIAPTYQQRAAAETNPIAVRKIVADVNKRLQELRSDASLFAQDGRLSPEGQAKLRRLVEWRRALMQRFETMPKQGQ